MRFTSARARSWALSALVLTSVPLGCSTPPAPPPDSTSNGDTGTGGAPNIANPCSVWSDMYCSCPVGPVGGLGTGESLTYTVIWQGFPDGSETPADIPLLDYYDCDGTLNINALLVVFAQEGCSPCAVEADAIAANLPAWSSLGIEVLTAMLYTEGSGPATLDTALAWKKKHGLDASTVVMAHNGALPPSVPYALLVDPRTLLITESGTVDWDHVVQLAQKNASP